MSSETDIKRLERGFLFTDQREVVQCPKDEKHGTCTVFRSQKGDLWHKCAHCVDTRETVKGEPNQYYGKPGVMVCMDGKSSTVRITPPNAASKKRKEGEAGEAAPPASVAGESRVDFEKYVRATLDDLQKKQDLLYQWMTAHLPSEPAQQLPDA